MGSIKGGGWSAGSPYATEPREMINGLVPQVCLSEVCHVFRHNNMLGSESSRLKSSESGGGRTESEGSVLQVDDSFSGE